MNRKKRCNKKELKWLKQGKQLAWFNGSKMMYIMIDRDFAYALEEDLKDNKWKKKDVGFVFYLCDVKFKKYKSIKNINVEYHP